MSLTTRYQIIYPVSLPSPIIYRVSHPSPHYLLHYHISSVLHSHPFIAINMSSPAHLNICQFTSKSAIFFLSQYLSSPSHFNICHLPASISVIPLSPQYLPSPSRLNTCHLLLSICHIFMPKIAVGAISYLSHIIYIVVVYCIDEFPPRFRLGIS